MKWLTVKDVKEYATTPERALFISRKHWDQIVEATEKEIRAFHKENKKTALLGAFLCGLCSYADDCTDECRYCFLKKSGAGCLEKSSQYNKAVNAYKAWIKGEGDFAAFKVEACKMRKTLDAGAENETERKYRGKRVDIGEWAYGYYVKATDGAFIMELDCYALNFLKPEYNYQAMGCGLEDRNITDRYQAMEHGWVGAVDTCSQNHPEFVEVRPETVGQYITKDKYDNDVWLGSKVKLFDVPTWNSCI